MKWAIYYFTKWFHLFLSVFPLPLPLSPSLSFSVSLSFCLFLCLSPSHCLSLTLSLSLSLSLSLPPSSSLTPYSAPSHLSSSSLFIQKDHLSLEIRPESLLYKWGISTQNLNSAAEAFSRLSCIDRSLLI